MRATVKTLIVAWAIWSALLCVLLAVYGIAHGIGNGELSRILADPDWIVLPIFIPLMYFVPAAASAVTFASIVTAMQDLPLWSIAISTVLSFSLFYCYEKYAKPYFNSGITSSYAAALLFFGAFFLCSLGAWITVRRFWKPLKST